MFVRSLLQLCLICFFTSSVFAALPQATIEVEIPEPDIVPGSLEACWSEADSQRLYLMYTDPERFEVQIASLIESGQCFATWIDFDLERAVYCENNFDRSLCSGILVIEPDTLSAAFLLLN